MTAPWSMKLMILISPEHLGEIIYSPLGEAYLVPMGEAARITFLLCGYHRPRSSDGPKDTYFGALKHFPALLERLAEPYLENKIEASGPVGLKVSCCYGDRMLLVGGADGSVDPVTGQGMTLALLDAFAASSFLVRRLNQNRLDAGSLSSFQEIRSRYFEPSYSLAEWLTRVLAKTFHGAAFLESCSTQPGSLQAGAGSGNRSYRQQLLELVPEAPPCG